MKVITLLEESCSPEFLKWVQLNCAKTLYTVSSLEREGVMLKWSDFGHAVESVSTPLDIKRFYREHRLIELNPETHILFFSV